MNLLIRWLISAASLLIVAYFVPGIRVDGFITALVAAVVIGLVNGTIGALIKLFTFPIRWLTLGVLSLVINAVMLMLSAHFVNGFYVSGFVAAFIGSILLSVTNSILGALLQDLENKRK